MKEEYRKRLSSPDEALRKSIKSGCRVVVGHACGEPQGLMHALAENREHFRDVEILHMVAWGKSEYAKPGMEGHFRHNSFFVGPGTFEAVKSGRAGYIPCFLSEIPRLFQERILPVDVALVQVSPPDEKGYCSFGISVDYTKPAAESAKIVVAQVNENMPRTLGDSMIHISDIDHIVEINEPLIEVPRPEITGVEKTIASNLSGYIGDGSTLQMGIGALPDALLSSLKGKRDLGVHTETFYDGLMELIEAGVITNEKKAINRGKVIASMIFGTRKLYDYVDNNPMIEMHPVTYTNNPSIIGKNPNVVSINAAIEVDLMGQVVADTIGPLQYSGVGGQVDFVRGASASKNGKSFIVMRSTAKGDSISKIVPKISDGAAITTTRNDVHFVATEFGVADLRGKTLGQRAEALIGIAHPKFRGMLMESMAVKK